MVMRATWEIANVIEWTDGIFVLPSISVIDRKRIIRTIDPDGFDNFYVWRQLSHSHLLFFAVCCLLFQLGTCCLMLAISPWWQPRSPHNPSRNLGSTGCSPAKQPAALQIPSLHHYFPNKSSTTGHWSLFWPNIFQLFYLFYSPPYLASQDSS